MPYGQVLTMGRHPIFSSDDLMDAAQNLVISKGSKGLTIASLAKAVGAPNGSIYHRFESRGHLVAAMWIRSVERFQTHWTDRLDLSEESPLAVVRESARVTIDWANQNPTDAKILNLHRSSDLIGGDWPEALAGRNDEQRQRVVDVAQTVASRLPDQSVETVRRLQFAMFEIPTAAIRSCLSVGDEIPEQLAGVVDDAICGVLGPILGQGSGVVSR